MVRARLIAATVAALLASGPSPARTIDENRSGTWTIAATLDDRSGAFVDCSGRSEERDGVALLLSTDGREGWWIGLAGNLNGSPGDTHPVRYRVDRGPMRAGVARVDQNRVVRVAIQDPAVFLEEVRRGVALTADAGAERLTFSLRDSRQVLPDVTACAQRRLRLAQAGGPAAGPDIATSAIAAPGASAERRLEAMTVAVNILSRARATGFELQPSDVPAPFAGHEVVWRAGDVTGSLRIVQGQADTALGAIRADLISGDIRACPGRFSAEAGTGPDDKSLNLATTCEGDKGRAATYLAFARPGGGAYVLSLTGAPDKVAALKAADAALRDPAVQVAARPR